MADSTSGLRIFLNPHAKEKEDGLHQHAKEKERVYVSSHADRNRIIEIFRGAMQHPGPPSAFALQTVKEAIKPVKQTVLIQDENQSLENALRTLLQELVSSAVNLGEVVMQFGQSIDEADVDTATGQIPRLLDIVLYLCERGHIEGGMIFQLLEDLTEMSTMKDCKEIFGYIESKQDILGKQELYGRGKLVMLRTCNQLLRKLSKANDVVFCGRIIMFLAHFFPLSERSAVNIKGLFNTSKETKYEKDAPEGVSIDFNFYKTFWSLQEHFSHRSSTNAPAKWQKFTSNLRVVLDTFEAQPLNDDDGDGNNIEEESAYFSTKYLTSSKLMGLELKDPSFRRHILVQCLILFDYLMAPGKSEKDVPSESMMEEIRLCQERVKKLLELIPPKGKMFLKSIEHILEREKNWVWWKRDGCQAFEKVPVKKKTNEDRTKKRKTRWRLGNKELSQLWKWADQNPNALTDSERIRAPSVVEYWKPLAEDMDESAGIEAEYHHKNNRVYCWKGLRFSARQDLEGFSRFTDLGIEGVIPPELLTPEVRSKLHGKPSERSKRSKREDESKGSNTLPDSQVVATVATPMVVGASDESQKHNSDLDIVQDQDGGQSEADLEAGDDEMEGGEIKEESNEECHKILKD